MHASRQVGISAWALATLKPKGWRKILRGLVARAGEEEVFGDLNWWSAAHLEYALRVASKVRGSLPRQEPQDAHDFLSKLSSLSANEVAQIRQDSKEFQERPLKVAAELQPWKGHPPCTVLIFGAQRHIRPALQQAGFTTTIWRRFASGSSTAKEWPQLEAEAEAAAIRYPDSSESFEFALHAVASSLAEGAPLWVYGDVREGVLSTTRSIKGLFTLSAIHEDGDCRVVSATRSRRKLQDTFESQLRVESIDFGHGLQDWWSVPGLFAAGRVDVMSQYLLDTMTYVRSKMAASNEKLVGGWHVFFYFFLPMFLKFCMPKQLMTKNMSNRLTQDMATVGHSMQSSGLCQRHRGPGCWRCQDLSGEKLLADGCGCCCHGRCQEESA